jgi:hypothetical protein
MKHFFYHSSSPYSANITIENKPFLIREIPPALLDRIKHNIVTAPTLEAAAAQVNGTIIIKEKTVDPVTSIKKSVLVEKLIAIGKAQKLKDILDNLPVAEKLRWDTVENISLLHPFIVENKNLLQDQLGLTDKQFNSIFEN